MSKKKFNKKYPSDEWEVIAKKQSGKGLTANNKKRIMRMSTGNLKKKISVKYYGHEETKLDGS